MVVLHNLYKYLPVLGRKGLVQQPDLEFKLRTIDAMVVHAEERQFTERGRPVKEWLDELLSFGYRFEFRFGVLKPSSKKADAVADEVETILEDLVDRAKDPHGSLCLREGVFWKDDTDIVFSATNSDEIPKNYVYGRGEEENFILETILSDHEVGSNTKLISIIGEAGAGKTALAGLIFFNYRVVKSFDFRLWVNIPEGADVCEIANKILKAVIEDEDFSPRSNFDDLLAELGKLLAERKFLLVLDGCWIKKDDLDNWERKLVPSLEGARGSVVILTARPVEHHEQLEEFLVRRPHHIPPLRLGLLSTEDCRPIISKRTSELVDFVDPDYEEDMEVEDVAAEIANKLGNLPLATKMIGSLLRNKTDDEWTKIRGNKYLTTRVQGEGKIPSYLALCYLDLPSNLRLCLEYLSIFPKGYEFTQKQVVLLWMAQGFWQNSSGSMEEVGNKYFHYLLKRSFFQPLAGGVSFRMHDLVHDLASYAFGESRNHHLSYYGSIEDFPSKSSSQHILLLKTLLPLGPSRQLQTGELEKIISRLNPQMLCALSLSHHRINDLPPIGKLIHLRYLDLSHTALVVLPDSICDLTTLQTLLLRKCSSLRRFPERMSHLASLSYLDLSETGIQALPASICDLYSLQTLLLTNCGYFTCFPAAMGNLTNLRCLDIRGTEVQEMPLQMDKLTSLQRLTDFIVSESSPYLEDLAGLSNLSTLTISNLENAVFPVDAFDAKAKLNKIKNLEDLILRWSSCSTYGNMDTDCQILGSLEPPSGIKRLTIESYSGKNFPNWVGNDSFLNLQSLKLCHCHNCTSLPPVGQLALLKDLVIEGFNNISCIGPEFYGNNTSNKIFQHLENLEFREMLQWKEWTWNNIENIKFPRLLNLSIICCPKLVRKLPNKLPSLEKLEIFGCYDLDTRVPETPRTCEVLVYDSHETLMSSVAKDLPQVTLCRQVLIPEGKKFPLQSYAREFQDYLDESGERPVQLDTEAPDTTDDSSTETASTDGTKSSFEILRVSNTSELEILHPDLDGLKIEGCKLPNNLLQRFSRLQELYLVDCCSFKPIVSSEFPSSLRTLYVRNCQNLVKFLSSSDSAQTFQSLEHLCIGNKCYPLQSLTLNFFPKLKTLSIWDCPDLICLKISDEFQGNLPLESLEISDCPNLKSFPKVGSPTRNLSSLVLQKCRSLESSSLATLPSSLTLLSIVCCDKLTMQESWGLNRLESLSSLEIEGGHVNFESFPDERLLPSNINSLHISTFQSLKKLDYKGFEHLNAIQTLEINNCKQLEYLPERGLPSSLSYLCIKGCPLLTAKIRKTAEDWDKVAHIRHLKLIDE